MLPKVAIVSNEKSFSVSLADFFARKGLATVVSSKDKIVDGSVKYLVIVNLDDKWTRNASLRSKIEKFAPKTVIINSAAGRLFEASAPVSQVFVDNVFPLSMKSFHTIAGKLKKRVVFLPDKAWVAVTTLESLLSKVAEELFSFSRENKVLLGKLVSYREIANVVNPVAEVYIDKNLANRLPRQDLAIEETMVDLQTLLLGFEGEAEPLERGRTKVAKWPIYAAVGCFAILLILPYVLLFVSGVSSLVAYRALKGGQIAQASYVLPLAKLTSYSSWRYLSAAKVLPYADVAGKVSEMTEAGGKVLTISDYAYQLGSAILKRDGDASVVRELSGELFSLYYDLSFMETEGGVSVPFLDIPLEKLSKVRGYTLLLGKLVREMPSVLGFDRPKTYMVLFQNNMELRPTGGFIGSFALLTFSKGELIDNTIYDVYSADGQLKGYIEPPGPIEEHLGEASWTLRDSNWDPDFPVSAARAEWFLDKSIDREVDGVVGINMEVARKFLEVLGPVVIADFGDSVDSKNMYEKVQFEVENDFFPGSRKKAQYLSALMNAVLTRLKQATFKEAVGLALATVERLEARDIQIVLRDPVQRVVEEQGWNGGVEYEPCGENCANVFAGLAEANLGVNKANYYVRREVDLRTTVGEKSIDYELVVRFANTASGRDRIPEQRYKVYVRAIAEAGAVFDEAYEIAGGKQKYFDVDIEEDSRKSEYGVLVEVLPGEQKMVVFKWSKAIDLDLNKNGSLKIKWWKQSGTGDYPIKVNLKVPGFSAIESNPPASLTSEGVYLYNTTLTRDLEAVFSWKQ